MNTSIFLGVALVSAILAFILRMGVVIFARYHDQNNSISKLSIFPATLPSQIIADLNVILKNSKLNDAVGIMCFSYFLLIFITLSFLFIYAVVGWIR